MPIKKTFLGHPVIGNASKYTNIISDAGVRFFPRLVLPGAAGHFAKKITGTARVFGVIGRVSGVGAIALGVVDAVLIGKCAYDAKNGK